MTIFVYHSREVYSDVDAPWYIKAKNQEEADAKLKKELKEEYDTEFNLDDFEVTELFFDKNGIGNDTYYS